MSILIFLRLFLVITKQCILQYVLIKPLMSLVAVICQALGAYNEGSFDPTNPYLYVTIIINISVSVSYIVI